MTRHEGSTALLAEAGEVQGHQIVRFLLVLLVCSERSNHEPGSITTRPAEWPQCATHRTALRRSHRRRRFRSRRRRSCPATCTWMDQLLQLTQAIERKGLRLVELVLGPAALGALATVVLLNHLVDVIGDGLHRDRQSPRATNQKTVMQASALPPSHPPFWRGEEELRASPPAWSPGGCRPCCRPCFPWTPGR